MWARERILDEGTCTPRQQTHESVAKHRNQTFHQGADKHHDRDADTNNESGALNTPHTKWSSGLGPAAKQNTKADGRRSYPSPRLPPSPGESPGEEGTSVKTAHVVQQQQQQQQQAKQSEKVRHKQSRTSNRNRFGSIVTMMAQYMGKRRTIIGKKAKTQRCPVGSKKKVSKKGVAKVKK